jgi:ATP-dependent DNA helicase RecG
MDYARSSAVGATWESLDPTEFERFRRLCRQGGDEPIGNLSDEDILRALGLVGTDGGLTLGAVLLFGTTEAIGKWAPSAEVLFQDLRAGDAQTNERFHGPLIRAAEWLSQKVDERQSNTELITGMFRVEVPLIPLRTRRESVANALVHRDYSALGPVVVQITDAEFSVSNPGGLPPGVTITNLLEQSRPRSPLLADAFKRAGLVDRRGKGVNDMFEQQLRAGRDVPDYSRTTSDSVTVIVPLGTANIDLVRFLVQFENDTQHTLGVSELRLVHEVHTQGSATAAELADTLSLPASIVRGASGRLVEQGVLESRGQGRSRRYHLTARFYDLAEDRAAYVRVKGADPLQQERMILDYVDSFGSITRSQAAQLCQTAPSQARRVLKHLVDDGRLALVGERRGARYVMPSDTNDPN